LLPYCHAFDLILLTFLATCHQEFECEHPGDYFAEYLARIKYLDTSQTTPKAISTWYE